MNNQLHQQQNKKFKKHLQFTFRPKNHLIINLAKLTSHVFELPTLTYKIQRRLLKTPCNLIITLCSFWISQRKLKSKKYASTSIRIGILSWQYLFAKNKLNHIPNIENYEAISGILLQTPLNKKCTIVKG